MPGAIRRWRCSLPIRSLVAAGWRCLRGWSGRSRPGPPAVAPAARRIRATGAGPRPEARRQFMIGERLFRAGRYREAARAYQRGYRLSHRPGFLINMAHCQVRLGRLELAREQYRRSWRGARRPPRRPGGPGAGRHRGPAGAHARPPAEPGAARADRRRARATAAAGPGRAAAAAAGRARSAAPAVRGRAGAAGAGAGPPAPQPARRWLWPVVGVAAAVVAGTVAVFAARDQRPGAHVAWQHRDHPRDDTDDAHRPGAGQAGWPCCCW